MLPIRLSELPEAPTDISQSGIFPVSDVPNDITYKLSLQQIPGLSANKNIKVKNSSYTITKNDYNAILYFNNVDNDTVTLTIPNNSSKNIQPGYSIKIVRYNTGNVHIVPENGVVAYSANGFFLHSQYSVATLTKIDTNTWIVEGHLFRGVTPGAPTNVVVYPYGENGAVLEWTNPASGGSAITGYVVQYSINGENWTTTTLTPMAGYRGYFDVGGFSQGDCFTFRVAAVNIDVTGSYSAASNVYCFNYFP